MSALPRPDLPSGPHRDLTAALHELHHRAGWPSLRRLAADAGCSHTTVSKTFSSSALPTWGTLELLVEAMDGDTGQFHDLWLSATGPAPSTAGGALPRIAGRRTELAAARRHLQTGSGLMLVLGEAGMGKTSLVSAASDPTAVDVFVATGHCLPLSNEVSLLPLVDILQETYEYDDGHWVEQALAECPAYVQNLVGRLLPEVATTPMELPPGTPHLLLSAIGSALKSLRSQRRLALLIEDLHWADPATLDLLEHMVARGPEVAVIGTWRTEDSSISAEAVEWLTRVRRLPTVTEVELAPLTREETAEQLALLDGHEPEADVVETIHERSLGLPLFTEQLAAHTGHGGELPSLLENLLAQRLSGISEEAWQVARILGIADRPLPDAILAEAAEITPREQTRALHELHDKRLLSASGASSRAQLRHPLLAEAVRSRLVAGEKVAGHRRLASALSAVGSADPAEIALHWHEADDQARELEWRVRAAHHAHERLDPVQETEHWTRVAELWPADGPPVELDGCADRDDALIKALQACEESDDWSRVLGLADTRLSELRGVATNSSARLHELMAGVHTMHEDRAVGLELARQSVELSRQLPVGPVLAKALQTYGFHLGEDGRHQEGLSLVREALDVAQVVGDPAVIFETTLAVAAREAYSGDLGSAMARIDALRAGGSAPSWPLEVRLGMFHTDILLTSCRPLAEVEEAGRASVDLSRIPGLAGSGVIVKINIALAMIRAGQVSRAASLLPVPEEAGTLLTNYLLMTWSWVELCRGRLNEARRVIAELDGVSVNLLQAVALRAEVAAQLELWSGQPGSASRRLRAALEELLVTRETDDLAPVFALAARAAADCRGDDRDPDALASLQDLRARASLDPFSGVCGDNHCWRAVWDAELARLSGDETPDLWVRAAAEWDRITRPHEAAYARWRGAQVAVRDGQGTVAARLLKRAATDAREHVPLRRAIAATAARVR